jgi:uncharacterized phage protein (TIGR02220 family)
MTFQTFSRSAEDATGRKGRELWNGFCHISGEGGMYNKLFTKILDSSIWLEAHTTRLVFITLLAAMDEDGYAHFSAVENLASRARVTVTQCNSAIKTLSEPDPNSCDPDFGGRRIERVPGGFIILNARKYREIANNASSRESTRLRVQKHRDRKASELEKPPCNTDVTGETLQNVTSASASASASELGGESEGEGTKPDKFSKARIALVWLNEKASRHYRETSDNLELVNARLSEVGSDLEGVKLMVSRQVQMWKGTEMEQYLRPETLFRKSKFHSYYDERNLPILGLKKVSPENPRNAGIGGDAVKRTSAVVAKVASMQKENEQQS